MPEDHIHPESLLSHAEGADDTLPSDYEEQIWLRHFQDPAQVAERLVAWQFPAGDPAAIAAAVQTVLAASPLAVIYAADADLMLSKQPLPAGHSFVTQLAAVTQDELHAQIATRQADHARGIVPARAVVAALDGGPVLALWLHPIAQERLDADRCIAAILKANPQGSTAQPIALDTDPASALTQTILRVLRHALDYQDLQPGDDFFDFGGHSMLATRVIGELLKTHGIEVRFNDFFRNATAAGLAQNAVRVTSPATATQTQTQAGPQGAVPLCAAQNSMWRAYELFDFGAVFNLPFALDFLDPVDEAVFARAFRDLVERHAGLRSHFLAVDGQPRQQVVPVKALEGYNWFWTSAESQGVCWQDEVAYVFDLSRELPFRLRFIADAASGRQVLSFVFHHLALDEWSLNILMDELGRAYQARSRGQAPVWAAPASAVSGFAQAQARLGIDPAHIAYWRDMLAPATHGLALPTRADHATDADGKEVGWLDCPVDPDVAQALYGVARQTGASLFNVLYAVIAAALHRLSGQGNIVIGTSADGRTDADYFDAIGYFTTMVAHRVDFGAGMSLGDLIAQCRDTVLASMPYTDVPIDLIEEALGIVPGRDRFYDAYIQIHAQNKLNGALPGADGAQIRYRQIDPDKAEAMLGLQFEIMEAVEEGRKVIRFFITYRTDCFTAGQVQDIRQTLGDVLTQIAAPDGTACPVAA